MVQYSPIALFSYVFIAMEALDTLLVACHSQSVNIFVESFLKMVQKLLEQNETEYQCVATSSVSKDIYTICC